MDRAVIDELRVRHQTWHSKMERQHVAPSRPQTPEYSSDSEMFRPRSVNWSNSNRKSRASRSGSMFSEYSFVDFTEEAAEYMCTPQTVTKDGTLQLEVRSLNGKKKQQPWKDYTVQLIMATSYQVETFGKKRFFLHCSTSAGRLGLSKRRFLTIPFTEITDLESSAQRVARGVLFSFKTSQCKLVWCAPDRAELDAWMAEMKASLAWENTGGCLPTLFHIRLTQGTSGSSGETLIDAMLNLHPRDLPEQLVIIKPVSGGILSQYPMHDVSCVGHDLDGCKLSIELQGADSPTEGFDRLVLHCPNHWRDDVLQALLCNVQRISGGVQCCRRGSFGQEQVMYYVTGQQMPVPQLHQYEEVVLPTVHRLAQSPLGKENNEKRPKKKQTHSYEKVESGNRAKRILRQCSETNAPRLAIATTTPSQSMQRAQSESELATLGCHFQRKVADLPPPRDLPARPDHKLNPADIENLRMQLMMDGTYSRPRPGARFIPRKTGVQHVRDHSPVSGGLCSRPRTPIVPARSSCFQEALDQLHLTPRSVTPDARSQRDGIYQWPRNATLPRSMSEERDTPDFQQSYGPFTVYSASQISPTAADPVDSGCGSSSSVNTALSPMGGSKDFDETGDDDEVAFYSNLVRPRKTSAQSLGNVGNRHCMVIEQDRDNEPVYTYNRLFSPASDNVTPRSGSVPADHSASDDTICPSFIEAHRSARIDGDAIDGDPTYRLPEDNFRTREVYALPTKLAVDCTTFPRLLKSRSLQSLHSLTSRENAYSPSPSPSPQISNSPDGGSTTLLARRAKRRHYFRRSPRPEPDADTMSDHSTNDYCPSPDSWGFGMISSPTARPLRFTPPQSPDLHFYHTMDAKQASPLVARVAADGRHTPTSALFSPNSKRPLPPAPLPAPRSITASGSRSHHYEEISLQAQ